MPILSLVLFYEGKKQYHWQYNNRDHHVSLYILHFICSANGSITKYFKILKGLNVTV